MENQKGKESIRLEVPMVISKKSKTCINKVRKTIISSLKWYKDSRIKQSQYTVCPKRMKYSKLTS